MPSRRGLTTRLEWETVEGWRIVSQSASSLRALSTGDRFVDRVLEAGPLQLTDRLTAEPASGVRSDAPVSFALNVRGEPGEASVVIVRHPSGALTFHSPGPQRNRRLHGLRFVLPLTAHPSRTKRSGATKIVRAFVLKRVAPLADRSIARLAANWEAARFAEGAVAPGWVRVTERAWAAGRIEKAEKLLELPEPPARSLLLLHGLLSDGARAFCELASSGFLKQLRPLYGDRIFAFNHKTLSQTPEENARELLAALPAHPVLFDVVTHSRGGIVMRTLVERAALLGPDAERFQLGRAVLVAALNGGTPLAEPARWQSLAGWVANLIDFFPKNPFTFGIGFVAEALSWMAGRAIGALPGVAALAPGSAALTALSAPSGIEPVRPRYSALVATFTPDESLLLRMLDAGVDRFFRGPNDLFVPTEGGWHLSSGLALPTESIGAFGAGGNLSSTSGEIHHLNFFSEPAAAGFIAASLLDLPRPGGVFVPGGSSALRGRPASKPAKPFPRTAVRSGSKDPAPARGNESNRFELVLIGTPGRPSDSQIFASYGGARVLEPFATKGGEAGERMRKIIATHERILGFLEGRSAEALPAGSELIRYGTLLFETLFPNEIRRLYDTARARGTAPLDIVFTSSLDWIADKPWEFAYDPSRASFLATEDVHFMRGVLTPVPAERVRARRGPLRILVAVAQPLGTALLATKEEEIVIRRGFASLIDAGLVTLDFVRAVTPGRLHDRITAKRFDILHFIGHGSYDEKARIGALLFEDARGATRTVDARGLRQLLCGRGLSLVVLNACETGRGGRADFNRGVAPSLVAGGIPAVIGNQYPVLDVSATEFSRRFYKALAMGLSLGAAAREARIAVSYETGGTAMDWAVPVLYARDPQRVICRRANGSRNAEPAPSRSVRAPSGGRLRSRSVAALRIGLWNVNETVLSLDDLALRLNRAQDVYRFVPVRLTAPLGSWHVGRPSHPEELTLDANLLAARLREEPGRLGVDLLIGITDLPIHRSGKAVFPWCAFPMTAIGILSIDATRISAPSVLVERLAELIHRLAPASKKSLNSILGLLSKTDPAR